MDRPSDLRELDEGDLASHALFLRRLAKRLVRDEASADDVAQETWRAALARPPRESVSWRAWLTTAARNVARQMARSSARRATHEPAAAAREGLPSTDEVAARLEAERRLIDAVAALPDDDRALILLRHFDGLPPRAIARRMQAPVETVKTRLKRALERLRARLVERGGDPRRLHSGLLLVANGLVGTVGAKGGVVGGVVTMSVKGKVASALIAAVVVVAVVQAVRRRGDARREASSIAAVDRVATSSAVAARRDDGTGALDASRAVEGAAAPGDEVPTHVVDDSPATEITGRVVDADGRPIEGAEICNDLDSREWPLRRLHAGVWPSARTDAEGRFVFRRPSKSADPEAHSNWARVAPYSGWADALVVPIDVTAAGYVPVRVSPNGIVGMTADVGDVQLTREARITGRVVFFNGDDPTTVVVTLDKVRPNEAPRVATFGSLPDSLLRVHCDEDGRFEIGGVSAGRYVLWVGAPGRRNAPSSALDLERGQSTDVELTLEAPSADGSIMLVRVLAPDRAAVAGATLDVAYREPSQQSVLRFVSDENGEAHVPTHGLPIDYVFASVPDGRWPPVTRKIQGRPAEDCELRFDETRRVVLLVRSADETPLEEVKVEGTGWTSDPAKDPAGGRKLGKWVADANGRVEVNLAEDFVRWRIKSDGFVETFAGPLRVTEVHAPIEVTLVPAPAFTGRVTFEGRPVAGALVSATCSTPGKVSTVHGAPSKAFGSGVRAARETGSDGLFRIQWQYEGLIFLHAHAIGFATAEIGPFDAGVANSASGLEIALTRGGSVDGRVIAGSDGSRARYVVVSNGDGKPRSWPITADGTFRVDHLAPGSWNVRTHDAPVGFDSISVRSNCGALVVLPSNCVVRDGETTTLTISADDSIDCVVRGEVSGLRDATTPFFLKWWQAWIGPSSRTDEKVAWEAGGEQPSVSFDKNGMVFGGGEPPPASFEVDVFEFRRDWCDPCDLVLALRLDGEDHSCVISLRRPWTLKQGITRWSGSFELGAIEGNVEWRSPTSIHVEADATTTDGFRYHSRVRVRDDGGFTIPRAPAGTVRVRVDGLADEQTVQVEAGKTTSVTLH